MSVCEHCQREMRDREVRAADSPELVTRMSNTCCDDCYRRIKRGIPVPGNDYKCARCHRWVDTSYQDNRRVKPSSDGVCRTCRRAINYPPVEPPTPVEPSPVVDQLARGRVARAERKARVERAMALDYARRLAMRRRRP